MHTTATTTTAARRRPGPRVKLVIRGAPVMLPPDSWNGASFHIGDGHGQDRRALQVRVDGSAVAMVRVQARRNGHRGPRRHDSASDRSREMTRPIDAPTWFDEAGAAFVAGMPEH